MLDIYIWDRKWYWKRSIGSTVSGTWIFYMYTHLLSWKARQPQRLAFLLVLLEDHLLLRSNVILEWEAYNGEYMLMVGVVHMRIRIEEAEEVEVDVDVDKLLCCDDDGGGGGKDLLHDEEEDIEFREHIVQLHWSILEYRHVVVVVDVVVQIDHIDETMVVVVADVEVMLFRMEVATSFYIP